MGLNWFDFCTFQTTMKNFFYLFLFFSFATSAQEAIETSFVEKNKLNADSFISKNGFESTFYIMNNVFIEDNKKRKLGIARYLNIQLGNITSANTFNSLKINLFYKDFNTVVILDNRLSEMFKIDFNAIQPYKGISNISTGYDNTLWIFNQDNQQLELYDYKTNITRTQTLPIKSAVLDLKSNYNYCWLLTKEYIYVYNYFGSLIKKTPNTGYTSIAEENGNIILKKNNSLFYLKKNTENIIPIKLPNLLIKQFFVTNESLYIYTDETLQQFQLKIN